MKFTTISSVVLGASVALAAPAPAPESSIQKRFIIEGAPSSDVTCPDFRSGEGSTFTAAYITNNIDLMLVNNKKKGSYPKPFNPDNPHAGQFTWQNNCDSAKVLELPLFKNKAGTEIPWWQNTDFDNNNNKPGIFREYYMWDADAQKATWCGAYAHADDSRDGDFVTCTW